MLDFHQLKHLVSEGLEVDVQFQQKGLKLFPGRQLELADEDSIQDGERELHGIDQEVEIRAQKVAERLDTVCHLRVERVLQLFGRLHHGDQASVRTAPAQWRSVPVGSVESREDSVDKLAGEDELDDFERVHEIDVEIRFLEETELIPEKLLSRLLSWLSPKIWD